MPACAEARQGFGHVALHGLARGVGVAVFNGFQYGAVFCQYRPPGGRSFKVVSQPQIHGAAARLPVAADGVAQYVGPGRVLLEAPTDPESPDTDRGRDNLAALLAVADARGRTLEVALLDPGTQTTVSYANHYLANGAVIVPVDGSTDDAPALARLAELHPDRVVVGVPGATLAFGGGGPHCITQQIPRGVDLSVL